MKQGALVNIHKRMSELKTEQGKGSAAAAALLTLEPSPWNDFETRFLEGLQRWPTGTLTSRQAELLVELQDKASPVTTLKGFSVPILIGKCYMARADLDEESAAFIESLHARGGAGCSRRQSAWLLRCAENLHLIGG